MMETKKIDPEKLEQIKREVDCPKGCKCLEEETECKAKKLILSNFIECLEDEPDKCKFAIRYGRIYFCKCPVKNMGL